jgi:GntR family transcriptional regulator, rspAB operon transcriptional repressor
LQPRLSSRNYKEQKVISATRKDQVYNILRQAIISSQLAPGEAIRKELVATQLGVSRTPVSEAINRLADEGLVEIYPQAGTFVARLWLNKIETAQFVRIALETAAIRRAAANGNAETALQLRKNLADQRKAAELLDFERFYEMDEALHDMICDASGLVGLREIAAKERSQIDRVRRLLLHYETRMSETLIEHEAIISAIARGDPDLAARTMEEHISKMGIMLLQLREKRPELFGD